ncbi:MAG: Outer-membrane lipoprotein LolB [Accumulibacter sp.]|uniref:lipoprotein insertase outer membrane protein LolB n=1 Tax=Accumulibacter sp. TaxID=2053492 RepID=UPI001221C8E8|nr:lipoprotein insertase outer membrane protein LolB [Accumulibacter sp.]TLD47502.1 MAG: Outer-membrane lipoprotein LolB [Accumulibacter sp.]
MSRRSASSSGKLEAPRRHLGLLLTAVALAACSSQPALRQDRPAALQRDQLQDFVLVGRFALRHATQNYAGRIEWQHAAGRDTLLLASPFGQGIAEITGDAKGARLRSSDGSEQVAASSDELLLTVLGYPVSLGRLLAWLRGSDGGNGRFEHDTLGRPLRLQHEDWRIAYEYDDDAPQALPGRLFVEREGGFVLRLRIDEWRLPGAADAPQ